MTVRNDTIVRQLQSKSTTYRAKYTEPRSATKEPQLNSFVASDLFTHGIQKTFLNAPMSSKSKVLLHPHSSNTGNRNNAMLFTESVAAHPKISNTSSAKLHTENIFAPILNFKSAKVSSSMDSDTPSTKPSSTSLLLSVFAAAKISDLGSEFSDPSSSKEKAFCPLKKWCHLRSVRR